MENNDLGLLKDHSHLILSFAFIVYGILITYLCKEYDA
jgi:hypothetical protein